MLDTAFHPNEKLYLPSTREMAQGVTNLIALVDHDNVGLKTFSTAELDEHEDNQRTFLHSNEEEIIEAIKNNGFEKSKELQQSFDFLTRQIKHLQKMHRLRGALRRNISISKNILGNILNALANAPDEFKNAINNRINVNKACGHFLFNLDKFIISLQEYQ